MLIRIGSKFSQDGTLFLAMTSNSYRYRDYAVLYGFHRDDTGQRGFMIDIYDTASLIPCLLDRWRYDGDNAFTFYGLDPSWFPEASLDWFYAKIIPSVLGKDRGSEPKTFLPVDFQILDDWYTCYIAARRNDERFWDPKIHHDYTIRVNALPRSAALVTVTTLGDCEFPVNTRGLEAFAWSLRNLDLIIAEAIFLTGDPGTTR